MWWKEIYTVFVIESNFWECVLQWKIRQKSSLNLSKNRLFRRTQFGNFHESNKSLPIHYLHFTRISSVHTFFRHCSQIVCSELQTFEPVVDQFMYYSWENFSRYLLWWRRISHPLWWSLGYALTTIFAFFFFALWAGAESYWKRNSFTHTLDLFSNFNPSTVLVNFLKLF